MKIGEIKRQALLLIFPELELSFDEQSDVSINDAIKNLRCDPSLRAYLDACVPAINRALSIIEKSGATKTKRAKINPVGKRVDGGIRVLLDECPGDIIKIIRVYQNGNQIRFEYEGEDAVILYGASNMCELVYKSKAERITDYTSEASALDLPWGVSEIIPYFVKSELLLQENSAEAEKARKQFFTLLDFFSDTSTSQCQVDTVFCAR